MELGDIIGIRTAEAKFENSLAARIGIDANFGYMPRLGTAKDEFKNYIIEHSLAANNYNISAAARDLGVDRKTVQRRMPNIDKHSINFYTGKDAVKSAIYRVLDKYLPQTQRDSSLIESKALELSNRLKGYKLPLDKATQLFEYYIVNLAVKLTGNEREAAQVLGVSERTVQRKLREEVYSNSN